MGVTDRKIHVDHVNGETLENTRANLRICTAAQNIRNQRLSENSTSGYKGVVWADHAKKWRTNIGYYGKMIYLGYFQTKEDAARANNEAAVRLFGKLARLNQL